MKKLLVLLLVLGLAAPAMAAEWNFYGQSMMTTFWTARNYADLDDDDITKNDFDVNHTLQTNSRIGANVKVNDQIGGRFEYGTGVNVRLLYGTYNFGAGELLVGQAYTPTFFAPSNQVYGSDADLLGWGEWLGSRAPMIQLKLGGFKVALVQPYVTSGLGASATYDDVDVVLPKLELAYSLKTDVVFFDVFGGYQKYALQYEDADNDESLDISSYVLGANVGANFGPVGLVTGLAYSVNPGTYGSIAPNAYGNVPGWARGSVDNFSTALVNNMIGPYVVDDEVYDANMLQAFFLGKFKVNDSLTFEAGLGYVRTGNAEYVDDMGYDTDYLSFLTWYANASITIVPGFYVVPEIGQLRYMAFDFGGVNGVDEVDPGADTYFGLKWAINF